MYNQNMSETKNNHYVPRFYLKNFLDCDEKIWKLDKTNNKIYHPDTLNAECSKQNLYTVKNKITKEEIDFVARLYNVHNDEILMDTINELAVYLNDCPADLVESYVNKNLPFGAEFNEYLKKKINNSGFSRTQETMITELYEENFVPIYQNIVKNCDISFIQQEWKKDILFYMGVNISNFALYYLGKMMKTLPGGHKINISNMKRLQDEILFYDIIIFMLVQYTRTKSSINKLKQLMEISNIPYIDNSNFAFLSMNIIIFKILASIIFNKSDFKLVLVKNNTEINFMTSDKPCINIFTTVIRDRLLFEDEMELFYPLSPSLAILFTQRSCYDKKEIIINSTKDIDVFNKAIIDAADRYLYADTEDLLNRYITK